MKEEKFKNELIFTKSIWNWKKGDGSLFILPEDDNCNSLQRKLKHIFLVLLLS